MEYAPSRPADARSAAGPLGDAQELLIASDEALGPTDVPLSGVTCTEGAPVSVYTVAKELGHGGESMVRRVYGHLGQVRRRAEVVEYRVQQHVAKLGERLAALKLGTTIDTSGLDSRPYRGNSSAATTRA